ncbi:MAG: C40 family peptidase [Sphingomonadales bacterium]
MTGRTRDPRVTPARGDLAARHLQDRVTADRYVDGTLCRVTATTAALRGQPDPRGQQTSELLFGELFTVYEVAGDWAWGQAVADGYVGYVPANVLDGAIDAATHKVRALMTHVYRAPDLKSGPIRSLSLESRVAVAQSAPENEFLRLRGGGWVFEGHLAAVDAVEPDFVAVAERLIGIPYLWGGRSAFGLDCSGLVQLALACAGLPAPRDSDMQAATIGERMPVSFEAGALRRGDLVFFPGHVGIMTDPQTLLHAIAWDMSVRRHPLDYVIERIGRAHEKPVTAIRRL